MAEIIGHIYVMYYDKVLPLDSSPASPFYREATYTIKYDIGREVMNSLGYDFEREKEWEWSFNTNSDAHADRHYPFGQYEFRRDKEYRIGRGRPTIVVLRNYKGEKEYLEIRSSSDVYNLRNRFQYKK